MTAFDPNDCLMNLSGKQYLQVKDRLRWLHAEHPHYHISTDIHQLTPEFCCVTASVAILGDRLDVQTPYGGIVRETLRQASGIGSETKADFRDYVEKAETKAIGRALAALGYGTQFCDDFDVGTRGDGTPSLSDAPVATRAAAAPARSVPTPPTPVGRVTVAPSSGHAPAVANPASDGQQNYVRSLVERLPWPENVKHLKLIEWVGTDLPERMTKYQAMDVITALQALTGHRDANQTKVDALVAKGWRIDGTVRDAGDGQQPPDDWESAAEGTLAAIPF